MTCAIADILPKNESALVSGVLVARRNFIVFEWQLSAGIYHNRFCFISWNISQNSSYYIMSSVLDSKTLFLVVFLFFSLSIYVFGFANSFSVLLGNIFN